MGITAVMAATIMKGNVFNALADKGLPKESLLLTV